MITQSLFIFILHNSALGTVSVSTGVSATSYSAKGKDGKIMLLRCEKEKYLGFGNRCLDFGIQNSSSGESPLGMGQELIKGVCGKKEGV